MELFESITNLNKFKEFSKSSYKETKSKYCWYCHKRAQEGLSYWEMKFLVTSGTCRGVCIPRSSKVHRLAKHRFFATAKVSQEVSQVLWLWGREKEVNRWSDLWSEVLLRQICLNRVWAESFYIENLLNRVELSGVFCWSKQRRRVMFRFKVHTDWSRGKLQDKQWISTSCWGCLQGFLSQSASGVRQWWFSFYKSFKKASFQVLADYLKTLVALTSQAS